MNVDDHDESDSTGRAAYAIALLAVVVPLLIGGSRLIARRAGGDADLEATPNSAHREQAPNIVPEALASDARSAVVDEVNDHTLVAHPGAPGVRFRLRDVGSLGAHGAGPGVSVVPGEPAAQSEAHRELAIVGLSCDRAGPGFGRGTSIAGCLPGGVMRIHLTNPLSANSVGAEGFSITPEIPGVAFVLTDAGVEIGGDSRDRTTYIVRVPAGISDEYGQLLRRPVEVTFKTGDVPPALYAPGQNLVVLDPTSPKALTVATVNTAAVDATLYRVGPGDWPAYLAYRSDLSRNPSVRPPWEVAWSGELSTNGTLDGFAPMAIDLTPALLGGLGHVVVDVRAEPTHHEVRWVEATGLELRSTVDANLSQVWVTDMATGEPVSGATVTFGSDPGAYVTDANGLAASVAAQSHPAAGSYISAQLDEDVALLPVGTEIVDAQKPLAWFVFDDRGVYTPGEQARIKGWLRPIDWGMGGGVLPPDTGLTALDFSVASSDDAPLAAGSIEVSAAGGFDLAVDLPPGMQPGRARLTLSVPGDAPYENASYTHSIEVAEFRRPEFEVSATVQEPYYFIGDTAYADVEALGGAGRSFSGGETRWHVLAEPAAYAPPGHDGFSFGQWTPPWAANPVPDTQGTSHELGVATDADGRHRLAIEVVAVDPRTPARFRAAVSVADVNRKAVTSVATFMLHPARYYVGLRTSNWFGETSTSFPIEAIVVDLNGNPIRDTPVVVTAERVVSVDRGGKVVEAAAQAGNCAFVSESGPTVCTLTFEQVGRFRVTAAIRDPEGRANATEIQLMVGGREETPFNRHANRVELIPEKSVYEPGDTARILILAPFSPSAGQMTVRRSATLRTSDFRMEESFGVVEVPITEGMLPNFYVHVELAAAVTGDGGVDGAGVPLPFAPAAAAGEIKLNVSLRSLTLSVSAITRDAIVVPGARTTVDVAVKNADGLPVAGAEVALVVVDESVLALASYEVPDPVHAFHPERGAGVEEGRLQDYVWPSWLDDLAAGAVELTRSPAILPVTLGRERGSGAETIVVSDERFRLDLGLGPNVPGSQRPQGTDLGSRFEPLALFAPRLVTNGAGLVSAEFVLPNSITRYRVTAVATDGQKAFGKGEATLTARLR